MVLEIKSKRRKPYRESVNGTCGLLLLSAKKESMDNRTGKASLCRHIKTNGHRCQAFAIGASAFCFFHRTLHSGHRVASQYRTPPLRPETVQYLLQHGQPVPTSDPRQTLHFPPLEDADAVQLAISLLFASIAAGHIELRRANTLLYTLQIASFNVRSVTINPTSERDSSTLPSRIVRNRHGQIIAARDENNGATSKIESPESLLAHSAEVICDPVTPSE